jgi:pimeloyl-ACP methyl ester carboxylesterase
MGDRRASLAALLAFAALSVLPACSTFHPPTARVRFVPDEEGAAGAPGAPIAGLDVCAPGGGRELTIDPARPLTVFVHGCKDSGGRFRELAQVFEAHGQQTACFNYDHRDGIDASAGQLARALEALERRLQPGQITLLAHSQGGLVTRRALVQERAAPLRSPEGFTYRLFTVSSPFAGIRASSDCAKTWLHVVTLGVTVLVCQLAAGDNWREIPPGSALVARPGTLVPEVREVLQVVTDERGSCEVPGPDGGCRKTGFVFSLGEQHNPAVEADARLAQREVQAGHVEIVGGDGVAPVKLIALLQERGILARTPPERREEIARLLARLYGTPGAP